VKKQHHHRSSTSNTTSSLDNNPNSIPKEKELQLVKNASFFTLRGFDKAIVIHDAYKGICCILAQVTVTCMEYVIYYNDSKA